MVGWISSAAIALSAAASAPREHRDAREPDAEEANGLRVLRGGDDAETEVYVSNVPNVPNVKERERIGRAMPHPT